MIGKMYFEKPGKGNTHKTLEMAYKQAKALGLHEIVLASTSGNTAYRALDIFKGFKIIAVTYHGGLKKPFQNVMPDATRLDLTAKGLTVISATHALSGIERAVSAKYGGAYPALLIADTLRLFGQGVKVAVEISIMAADAGLLCGKDIVTVGGTSQGADAALVLKPANQANFFDLRIRQIICKPSNF